MRILALADIHGGTSQLSQVLDAAPAASQDLIVVAGDTVRFLDPGGFAPVARLLTATGVDIVAVAGNCDGPKVEALLTAAGWNISGGGRLIGDVGLAGAAGAPPYVTCSWHTADHEIGLLAGMGLREISTARTRILIAHTPPAGVIAETARGPQELPGSQALRQAIDTYQPHMLICGHIHEGRSITQVGRTTVVCCGSVRDGSYATIDASRPGAPQAELHYL